MASCSSSRRTNGSRGSRSGSGLEGLLTNGRSAEIVQGLSPASRPGDYDEGIESGVGEIIRTLESESRRPAAADRADGGLT